MKKIIIAILIVTGFAACHKPTEYATPLEQELITTLRLNIKDSGGNTIPFNYKIENGFGSTTGGTIEIDTLVLAPNTTYSVITQVLNEKDDPAEDITTEVIGESEAHLFLYLSNPATGAGSIATANGNLDNTQRPFNQTMTITTGPAGSGTFTVYLLHEPTDKTGATPSAAGGETDVEAVFPVKIQ